MRSRWQRRTRPHGRAELAYALQYWASTWVVLLGLVPVVIAMAVGAAQGTATQGLFLPAASYPALTTLSGLMAVPALCLLGAFWLGVSLPLEDDHGPRRSDMLWLATFGIVITIVSLVLDEGRPAWLEAAPFVAAGLFAIVVALVAIRTLLRALRWLPRTWLGNYRSTDA